MIPRLQKVIPVFVVALLISLMMANSVRSAGTIKHKVDSLFVIASSGEMKYRDQVQPGIDSIAAMGVDAVPVLVDKFTTNSARERLTIINILKKIGSPAVPYLVESLRRPEWLVVSRVCWALGDIKDSAAVIPLVGACGHSGWQVREKALDALGKIEDAQAEATVLSALTDSVGQVRKAAVVAAGRLGLLNGINNLVHMLGDDFYGARMSAVEVLAGMDSARVRDALADSLHSDNRLLGNLACHVLGLALTEEAVDLLIAEAESTEDNRRAHAVVALIRGDPGDHWGYHNQLLEKETDRLVRLKIESAIRVARNVKQEN